MWLSAYIRSDGNRQPQIWIASLLTHWQGSALLVIKLFFLFQSTLWCIENYINMNWINEHTLLLLPVSCSKLLCKSNQIHVNANSFIFIRFKNLLLKRTLLALKWAEHMCDMLYWNFIRFILFKCELAEESFSNYPFIRVWMKQFHSQQNASHWCVLISCEKKNCFSLVQ